MNVVRENILEKCHADFDDSDEEGKDHSRTAAAHAPTLFPIDASEDGGNDDALDRWKNADGSTNELWKLNVENAGIPNPMTPSLLRLSKVEWKPWSSSH